MIEINPNSSYPLYLQLIDMLRSQIQDGKLEPGQALPAERELSHKLKINRRTISRAMSILEREGLVRKIRGSGVFVEEQNDFVAFNNSSSHSKVVAISIPECIENSHAAEIAKGAIARLEENGIQALRIHYIRAQEEREHISLNRNFLAGVILYHFLLDDHVLKNIGHFISIGLPVVGIGNFMQNEFDRIRSEDEAGAATVVDYFVNSGHKNIAFVSVKNKNLSSQRFSGYEQAMKKNGRVPEIMMCDADSGELFEAGCQFALKTFSRKKFPTAVFAQNDILAAGIYKGLCELKIKVPEHVELIGFGNDLEAAILFPGRQNPISTVAIDRLEIGKQAVDLLINRWENPSAPYKELITPVKLLHRRTSHGNLVSTEQKVKNH